jgi:predicted  nucleic acid-binding Zn-ribbon protein
MDEAELRAKLLQLQDEEREVSAQRVKLHERLSSFENPVAEEQERELSAKRRELHEEIDRIRGLLNE